MEAVGGERGGGGGEVEGDAELVREGWDTSGDVELGA